MNILFEKKIWFEAKAKLERVFTFLSEYDFQYQPGKEKRMLERIRTKIGMPRREFYEFTGLMNPHPEFHIHTNQTAQL